MAHIHELKAVKDHTVNAMRDFEDVVFWRRGSQHLSVLGVIGLQLMLHWPSLIPAVLMLMNLINLNRTYRHARHDYSHPLYARPSFSQVCCMLLPDRWNALPAAVTVPAAKLQRGCLAVRDHWLVSKLLGRRDTRSVSLEEYSKGNTSDSFDEDGHERATSRHTTSKEGDDEEAPGEGSLLMREPGPLEQQETLIRMQVHGYFQSHKQHFYAKEGARFDLDEEIDDDDDDDDEPVADLGILGSPSESATARESRMSVGRDASAIQGYMKEVRAEQQREMFNPLAKVLGPIQDALGMYAVMPLRIFTYAISWEDPFTTTWVYFGFCVAFFVCLFVPLIPWVFLITWGLKLAGFLALGPHMYFVGRHLKTKDVERQANEEAFAKMTKKEKKKSLRELRGSLIREETRRLMLDAEKLDPEARRRLLDRCKFFENRRHRLLVPSELSMARIKQGPFCDPLMSFARAPKEATIESPSMMSIDGDDGSMRYAEKRPEGSASAGLEEKRAGYLALW